MTFSISRIRGVGSDGGERSGMRGTVPELHRIPVLEYGKISVRISAPIQNIPSPFSGTFFA